MTEFALPIKVYIEDTDAGGIVYHANYLKYMERARSEFITELGYDKPATLANGLLLVVHSIAIDYLIAAQLGEQLLATAAIKRVARTYVVFEQQVRRAEVLLSKADVKVACITKSTMKPAAMPENLRLALQSRLPKMGQHIK